METMPFLFAPPHGSGGGGGGAATGLDHQSSAMFATPALAVDSARHAGNQPLSSGRRRSDSVIFNSFAAQTPLSPESIANSVIAFAQADSAAVGGAFPSPSGGGGGVGGGSSSALLAPPSTPGSGGSSSSLMPLAGMSGSMTSLPSIPPLARGPSASLSVDVSASAPLLHSTTGATLWNANAFAAVATSAATAAASSPSGVFDTNNHGGYRSAHTIAALPSNVPAMTGSLSREPRASTVSLRDHVEPTARDWHSEFQLLLERPASTPEEASERMLALHQLRDDFIAASLPIGP